MHQWMVFNILKIELQVLCIGLDVLGYHNNIKNIVEKYIPNSSFKAKVLEYKKKNDYKDFYISENFEEFQLMYGGPYMLRDTNQQIDSRVHFYPDEWQRKLLDIVDLSESALINAPTSSGKTFISYYAISKIIDFNEKCEKVEDKQRVLIYYYI
jgi:superfamily II RNA helicase